MEKAFAKIALRNNGIKVRSAVFRGNNKVCLPSSITTDTRKILNRLKKSETFISKHVELAIIKYYNRWKVNPLTTKMYYRDFKGVLKSSNITTHSKKKIFTSFQVSVPTFHKVEELKKYYGVTRSAMVRYIIETS